MKRLAAVVVIVLVALLTGVAGTPTQPAEAKAKPYEVSSTEVMLESRGIEIPATVVVPVAKNNKKFPLVIMHHGHGGGRQEGGGFIRLADALAEAGIMTIRMDFAGAGDSTEPFTKLTYTTMLADSDAALLYAVENLPVKKNNVGAIGYSEGSGVVAMQAGQPNTPYKAVALMGPVAHPMEVFALSMGGEDQFWTYYAEAQLNGYAEVFNPWRPLPDNHSLEWFDETIAADPVGDIERFDGRVLLVWGEEEQTIPFGEVEAYMAATEDSAKSNKLVTIPDADHGYGFYSYPPQPEIDEALHKAFIDFFKKALK